MKIIYLKINVLQRYTITRYTIFPILPRFLLIIVAYPQLAPQRLGNIGDEPDAGIVPRTLQPRDGGLGAANTVGELLLGHSGTAAGFSDLLRYTFHFVVYVLKKLIIYIIVFFF